ncbi:MAG: WD40/YVTN/BNR-like repeat-containing protein [Terriglobales bacterium]
MRYLRLLVCLVSLAGITALAQVNPQMYAGLHWRLLGTMRGGKGTSVVGVPGSPAIYYMGTAASGVWKTDDGGRTWHCISDPERLTGIGALAAGPDGLLYVAVSSAGGSAGPTGLYRSTDAGASLHLVALQDHLVADVWLDASNPQLVLAASDEGISRSSDGGRTWAVVLEATTAGGGAVDIEAALDAPRVLYAAFYTRPRRFSFSAPSIRPALPIYRSRDGGRSWKAVAGRGLPASGRGRVGLAVAPGSHGQRVYAYMAQGVFRSDDGGATWAATSHDPRLVGGGQFFHIYVNPSNASVLYAMETAAYWSQDGGSSWQAWAGAPSGDDVNALWIDPRNPLRMGLAVDQGTEISMNGGHRWTSWYNQPTGQMYNVSTDNQFPFHLYASQQDSGTVDVPIRANDGEITYRDWRTTNGFESARITPDPLHPNIVYATGWFGSVLRTDFITGQSVHVFARNPKYRESGSMPMEFLPGDPQTLLLGTQYVLATSDGGMHWKAISPDLSAGKGAISTIAPSPVNHAEIWVGTSDGKVQLTTDNGSTWRDVTPPGFKGAVGMIEPGQENASVAFAVKQGVRFGPAPGGPDVYRTDDNGRTWTAVVGGLPGRVNAIRQDPKDKSLLFAAANAGVYVSFDGGRNWESLELNLPASSCRDLQIRHNDLVLATFGRGLWSLDDIASLRQLSVEVSQEAAHLFRPESAIRLQWDDYTDTPINPGEPHTPNPPDGAILDYSLSAPVGELKLSIYDSQGRLVNSYSNHGPEKPPYMVNVPNYWLAPPQILPDHAGLNRFVWNLRYPDPPHILFTYFGLQRDYFEYTLADHAIPHNTPWHEPQGPMVVPGTYKLVLTAGGQNYSVPLTVKLDPRLTQVTQADLQQQLGVAQNLVDGLKGSVHVYDAISAARQRNPSKSLQKLQATVGHIDLRQARLLSGVTQADAAVGAEVRDTVAGLCRQLQQATQDWKRLEPSSAEAMPSSLHNCDEDINR